MSGRSVQLNGQLCDQDKKILELFGNNPVRYIGKDTEFAQYLTVQPTAPRLILTLNRPMWWSTVVEQCQQQLTVDVTEFYISINRYQLLGNDTTVTIDAQLGAGAAITNILEQIVNKCGFVVTDKGYFDNDRGRYFNFVQPLTWIYGTNATNQS